VRLRSRRSPRATARTAPEVAYDVLLEDEGRGFIYSPLVNYADFNTEAMEAMLADPNTIMGLGDGGAHVGFILDAGFPTWLLTYWGRERGRFALPEVIRRLTSDTAHASGLFDRGVLAPGLKADINILDHDALGFGKPYVVHDLPAGGRRLLQKASGYVATIVSGTGDVSQWRGHRRTRGQTRARPARQPRRRPNCGHRRGVGRVPETVRPIDQQTSHPGQARQRAEPAPRALYGPAPGSRVSASCVGMARALIAPLSAEQRGRSAPLRR
jgi:hypothetical protein